jgi:predicted ester cyclase
VPKDNCFVVTDMLLRQYNERDLSAVDEYIAEDHIDHNPMHDQLQGRAGVKKLIADVLASADVTAEIHNSFGEGDLVFTRYTTTIRPRGDFLGFPADGKTVSVHVLEMDRVRDGQIVESWGESNFATQMQALTAEITT